MIHRAPDPVPPLFADAQRRRLTPRARPAAVWVATMFVAASPGASAGADGSEGGVA